MAFSNYIKNSLRITGENLAAEFRSFFRGIKILITSYKFVILKRTELHLRDDLRFSIAGTASLDFFRYTHTVDSLKWGNGGLSDPYGPGGEDSVKNRKAFADAAAQVLLLNNKTAASFGHSFHVLSPSQFPVVFALTTGALVLFILMGLRSNHHSVLAFAHCIVLAAFVSVIVSWILMVFREELGGAHTLEVQQSFRIGIVLFIASEFMLFFAFFWAFFHFCLNPSAVTNGQFVAEGVVPFFWYRIPLLNTVILLSSGISLTLAHAVLGTSDRAARVREWQQVFISGVFLLNNNNFQLVNELDAAMAGRADIRDLPRSYSYKTKHDVLVARGDMLEADRLQANYVTRAVKCYALFRWSDDCRLHNAIGYAFAELHDVHNDTGYELIPHRSGEALRYTIEATTDEAANIESANSTKLSLRNPRLWVFDTITRGFVFLTLQAYEYISGLFTIADSVYGAVFYTLTGLHGLHVFVGVLMLMGAFAFEGSKYRDHNTVLSYFPLAFIFSETIPVAPSIESGHLNHYPTTAYKFNYWTHRVAFDGVAWYWHFVDVVWLFVFIFVYWYSFPANYIV